MKKQSILQNGAVFIIINQSTSWDFPPPNLMKVMANTFSRCLPLKLKCMHVCLSSLYVLLVFPTLKYFLSREIRLRLQLHNAKNEPNLLKELGRFGLKIDNLPRCIGGNYTTEAPHIEECNRILKERKKLSKERKRERNA